MSSKSGGKKNNRWEKEKMSLFNKSGKCRKEFGRINWSSGGKYFSRSSRARELVRDSLSTMVPPGRPKSLEHLALAVTGVALQAATCMEADVDHWQP